MLHDWIIAYVRKKNCRLVYGWICSWCSAEAESNSADGPTEKQGRCTAKGERH